MHASMASHQAAIDTVDFGAAEERAAEWRQEGQWGVQSSDVSVSFHNLLTAAGEGNDSSTVFATVSAIANFIRDGAWEEGDSDDRYRFVHACWGSMDMMASSIPPHHLWHTALVGAVRMLYARGDEPMYSLPDQAHITWSSLYDLCYIFWDFYDGMMPFRDMKRDEQEGPEACKQVVEWKN
ncbi:hypothetical protein B0T25DRAFT_567081 [Lasiosphaeria hispida]|uniref:Uncharacterized protein n=1 Tax=Lasiosphaeria hispida TaxID=260671 RepID=A0AAJ0HMZ0_9PEZI|nr:hypothetical protein B0T25DRAFT_567081 [Lasiosphaeria hispida]